MNTKLLACKNISDVARQKLKRAGCTIHKEVPGLDGDIEIVELKHDGGKDLNIMFVWDIPREIEVKSRNLHLFYAYNEQNLGFELSVLHEEYFNYQIENEVDNASIDDLEDCIF